MSASRTSRRLVRLYPSRWRARYGEELEALIVESSGGRRVRWRVRLDVALAAAGERLRAADLVGEGAPADRMRGGVLLVLWAWALFVLAGAALQKLSEHWQDATPAAGRALPSAAFETLVIVAGCATVLVLAGLAWATPSLVAFLRDGGGPAIRGRVAAAALATGVEAAATVGLVVWAHRLSGSQRAGSDSAYAIAFVGWALLGGACLAGWTAVASATARRLRLPIGTLRLEAWIALAVTVAMGAMTVATAVWWAALGDSAPWFLAGRPPGSHASPLAPELVATTALMLVATVLGAAGARRALRA